MNNSEKGSVTMSITLKEYVGFELKKEGKEMAKCGGKKTGKKKK